MRISVILFLLLIDVVLPAQNILLKGYVFDKDSRQPLPLSSVQIKNTPLGSIANGEGYFELPVPKTNSVDSVRISFIGYLPKTISLATYSQADTLKIFLEPHITTKQEVPVVALTARRILLNAIDSLRKNLYSDSVVQTGFYRQYHNENGAYVRLIEADVGIAFNVKNPFLYDLHELIAVNKERRSENYENNGDIHGDHLVDLLEENPFSYKKSSFLNSKNVNFFSPKIESEDSGYYILRTEYKQSTSEKLERAKIWVQKETFAIIRIEAEKFPNPYYLRPRNMPEARWKFVNEKEVMTLEKRDSKYFVSSLERVYNHQVRNRKTGAVDYVVQESFAFYFDDFKTKDVSGILKAGNFVNFTSLYTAKYNYDEKFWSEYDAPMKYALPTQVKNDLEHSQSLEEQFRNTGK